MTNGQSSVKPAMFGLRSPNVESGAEPPPRINRANKPNRFKGAYERLFGRSESNDIDNTPDYINTTIPAQPLTPAPNSKPTSNGIEPNNPAVNGRVSYMDNSSYSSDSYKYGSPTCILDN